MFQLRTIRKSNSSHFGETRDLASHCCDVDDFSIINLFIPLFFSRGSFNMTNLIMPIMIHTSRVMTKMSNADVTLPHESHK